MDAPDEKSRYSRRFLLLAISASAVSGQAVRPVNAGANIFGHAL